MSSAPAPGYYVLVLGSDRAPADFVAAKLEQLLAAKCGQFRVTLLLTEYEENAAAWGRTCDYCSIQTEHVNWGLWGRRYAPIRWAYAVAAVAQAVVVFGDDDRHWWRALRCIQDVGAGREVPIRRITIPPGLAVAPREETPRAARMDGRGPGGWPD